MLHSLLLLLTVATAPPLPSAAQDQADERRGRAARQAESRLTAADVVNVLDGYAIAQAQNALQLNEAQYGQFVIRLKNLHQTRRRALQERNRLVQQLRRLAGPQAVQIDETAVRNHMKALRDHEERTAADLRKAYEAVDEVLDVRQQARFRLFEEALERRKLDLLMRARQGAAPRR